MKNLTTYLRYLFFALLVLFTTAANAQDSTGKPANFYEKGVNAPATNFTGTVWVNNVVLVQDGLDVLVTTVTFEPGARTNWHIHPGGQVLLVTEGKGYYQEKGKPLQYISKGDVLKCPPGGEHWHGATFDSKLVHVAIVTKAASGPTRWMQKVTDEEYRNLK